MFRRGGGVPPTRPHSVGMRCALTSAICDVFPLLCTTTQVPHARNNRTQVVGVFIEGATPEEAEAARKLAVDPPPAPTPIGTLAEQGVAFALSRM